MSCRCLLPLLGFVCLVPATNANDRWLQFRGPGALGVADGQDLPIRWSETENLAWKRDIPGRGWSSPLIIDGRIYLTNVVNSRETEEATRGLYFGGERPVAPDTPHVWQVLCLDLATGEPVWDRTVREGVPPRSMHIKNSYASETPVSDGERIYCYFGNIGVFCLNLEGEVVWEHPLEAHATRFEWGPAASPALHDGRLYIVNDNEEASYLLALDAETGDEIWRVAREEASNWSTPFVWENELRTEIITPGTGMTRSYDLEGNLLYEFGGASAITIATPYAHDGLLYVSSGYVMDPRKPIWAIRPGASGDITLGQEESANESIAWCVKDAAPYNPTTLVYEDQLYVLLDRGIVSSYDAATGEMIYDRQRLPGGQAFTASPWAYDDHVFFLNEFGETFVIKAGREFELVGTNELDSEPIYMSTPSMASGKLLIRSSAALYCFE
jgi:outer membrane protein assembly factor BamB